MADVLFLQARIELKEDPSAALDLVREAIDILEDFYEGKPHQATAQMLEAAAELLLDGEGEPEEGIKLQRKAVDMYTQLFGEDARDSITASLALATFLQHSGEGEEAHTVVQSILSGLEGTSYHKFRAMAYSTLAEIEEDNIEAAIDANKKALAELDKLGRPHEMQVVVHGALVELYRASMDAANAVMHMAAACAAAKALSGEDSAEYASQLHGLATLMLQTQQPEKAVEIMETATRIRVANNVSEDEVADGLLLNATALRACHRMQDAAANYERALQLITGLNVPEIESRILASYGDLLASSAADEESVNKGYELMERAHALYIEVGDFMAVATIPISLYTACPEQAMRWMPMFDIAAEALEDLQEELEQHEPQVASDFKKALAEIRSQVQGRITKAAC